MDFLLHEWWNPYAETLLPVWMTIMYLRIVRKWFVSEYMYYFFSHAATWKAIDNHLNSMWCNEIGSTIDFDASHGEENDCHLTSKTAKTKKNGSICSQKETYGIPHSSWNNFQTNIALHECLFQGVDHCYFSCAMRDTDMQQEQRASCLHRFPLWL